MGAKSHKKDNQLALVLLLLIAASGLFVAYFSSSPSVSAEKVGSKASRSEGFEKSVNKHLMFTNDRVVIERQKIELENNRLLLEKSAIGGAHQEPYSNENKLDLSSENVESHVAAALGRSSRQDEVSSPQDVIQREVFSREQMAEYTQAYKEEYARQFIENARKGGYRVILSEDLNRVISVQPIKAAPKDAFQVFPSNSPPAQ